MDRAVLDTDTLSEVVKRKDLVVAERARAYLAEHGRFTISAVTVMEVVQGFQAVQREPELQRFLSRLAAVEVVAVDAEVGILAGRIYGDLKRKGQPIGRADPIIAATALRSALRLVTGNAAHYERIIASGYSLRIESWRPA